METHDRHSKNHIFMMSSENIFEEKEVKTFASAKLQQKYVAGYSLSGYKILKLKVYFSLLGRDSM